MAVLELKNVSKTIGGELVLRRIDLAVGEGVVIAIRGRSGVGKTTLARVASLLARPDTGSVYFMGRDTGDLGDSEKSRLRLSFIGYVDQECSLLEELTVWENIELPLRLLSIAKAMREERVSRILEVLGLKGLEQRRPRELSGGQRQRVAIARALVKEPRLLVGDELLAHLDDETARSVLDYIEQQARETGMAVLITTTDLYVDLGAHEDYFLENGVLRKKGKAGKA